MLKFQWIIDCYGYSDLAGGNHVDGAVVVVENLEYPVDESGCQKHP